jgi:hypothetical protein
MRAAFGPRWRLRDVTHLSIGRAALGGPKPGSAFLVGDDARLDEGKDGNGCSCTLQSSEWSAGLGMFFGALHDLVSQVPSLVVLLHTVKGSRIDDEVVRTAGREAISLSDLEAAWLHLPQDVRYLVTTCYEG